MITDEAIKEAWDRIARTPDGVLAYLHMQKVAIGLLADVNSSDGTLRHENGRRSLAHELMGLMSKGIDESGGRSELSSDARRTERPVVFSVRPSGVAPGSRVSIADWRRNAERADAAIRQPAPGDD